MTINLIHRLSCDLPSEGGVANRSATGRVIAFQLTYGFIQHHAELLYEI